MMPVAVFSPLFGTEDACLPVGREERKAQLTSIQQLYSYFLSLLAK
jgi:hypothetical protein